MTSQPPGPVSRTDAAPRARPDTRVVVPLSVRQGLLVVVDLLIINLALFVRLRYTLDLPFAWTTLAAHWEWFLVLSGIWIVIAGAGDNYNSWRSVTPGVAVLGVGKALALTLLVYSLLPLVTPPLPATRALLLAHVGGTAGLLALWRLGFALVFRRSMFRRRTLIVGAGESGQTIAEALIEREPSHHVLGFVDDDPSKQGERVASLPVLGRSSDLATLVDQTRATDIVIAIRTVIPPDVVREMLRCYEHGVRIVPMPALHGRVTGRVPVEHIGDPWLALLPIDRDEHTPYAPVKRGIDVAVSLAGLLVLAPLFPFIALAIKLDSPGPVFYRPQRLGRGGRPFALFKLRTMVAGADRVGDPTFTGKNDARVTRVGRVLRAAHVDELPQFINILKGEMSLVGPRPERYVKELEDQIPYYRMRLAVRPGTAGWALVKQGYAEGTAGTLIKLQYDLFYIKHMSFRLDMVILIRTSVDMLFRRGR